VQTPGVVIVVFAAMYSNPSNHFRRLDACFVRPARDVINHFITHIRFSPGAFQTSPRLFFSCTWEAIISAITSSLPASLAFNWAFCRSTVLNPPSSWCFGRRLISASRRAGIGISFSGLCRMGYYAGLFTVQAIADDIPAGCAAPR